MIVLTEIERKNVKMKNFRKNDKNHHKEKTEISSKRIMSSFVLPDVSILLKKSGSNCFVEKRKSI